MKLNSPPLKLSRPLFQHYKPRIIYETTTTLQTRTISHAQTTINTGSIEPLHTMVLYDLFTHSAYGNKHVPLSLSLPLIWAPLQHIYTCFTLLTHIIIWSCFMTTMSNHVLKRKSHNKITLTRTKKSYLVVMVLPCILKQGKKIKTQRLIYYDNYTRNLVDNNASYDWIILIFDNSV